MVSRPSVDVHSARIDREQLPLFSPPMTHGSSSHGIPQQQQMPSIQERLAVLLKSDLNFHGENSSYASHDVHAFAAKFPPQLPRTFIHGLTAPGALVLDPMMGSGTTVVEALLAGRCGIGLDIDPLALRLTQVKTRPLHIDGLREIGCQVVAQAQTLLVNDSLDEKRLQAFDEHTKSFIDYWFRPQTQRELCALTWSIQQVKDSLIRRFLELTFSSIIITKSGGVSLARDLAHSRPHLDPSKEPKNAIEQFAIRLQRTIKSIAHIETHDRAAVQLAADARSMPLLSDSIDLIVTSPPYANAIDYMRAHKFSLVWFHESVKTLSQLRAQYIGSERTMGANAIPLPKDVEGIIRQLAQCDTSKAAILRKYLVEMHAVMAEMYRVLRTDCAAIVIVGPSIMRGIDVQTHHCLAEIAHAIGFSVVGVVQRLLDRNKRMMPARFGMKTNSMIEQRMHEEYVIGLLKPPARS